MGVEVADPPQVELAGRRSEEVAGTVVEPEFLNLEPPAKEQIEVAVAVCIEGGDPVDGDVLETFMAILLKYRSVMGLGEVGQDLVAIARELRALRGLLSDHARATVVAVSRAAELPRLETRRLLARLRAIDVGVGAVLVNALTPPGCARCRRVAATEARVLAALRRDVATQAPRGCAIIQAPAVAPPPRAPAGLAGWRRRWTIPKP